MHADFRALAVSPHVRVRDADVRFNQLFQLLEPPNVIRLTGDHRIQVELTSTADSFSRFYTDVSQTPLPLFFFVMMIVVVVIMIAVRTVLVTFFGMFMVVMIVVATRPMFVMFMGGVIFSVIMMFVAALWPMFVMFVGGMIFRVIMMFMMLVAAFRPVFVMRFVIAGVAVLVLAGVFVMIVFATRMMNVFSSFLRWVVAGHFSVLQH